MDGHSQNQQREAIIVRPSMPTAQTSSGVQWLLDMADQLFELDRKIRENGEDHLYQRNIDRLQRVLGSCLTQPGGEEGGIEYHDPLGEPYDERRTDLEATITGESAENLEVIEVIKPIIRFRSGNETRILRPGIVIARSKTQLGNSNE